METIIQEDSPLAVYLEGEGGEDTQWASSHEGMRTLICRLAPARNTTVAAIHNTCSRAVNSRLGRADNAKFLERFRYVIVASQLLNTDSFLGQTGHGQSRDATGPILDAPQLGPFTLSGAAATAALAFSFTWLIHWTRGNGTFVSGKIRLAILSTTIILSGVILYTYVRRQWLQYLRQQSIVEASQFVHKAQEFDAVAAGALTLVSRGGTGISWIQAKHPLATRYTEGEFDDEESVRVLKIFAARFHTIRKIFLCCLLAFDAHGGETRFPSMGLAVDELHTLCSVTSEAEDKLRRILGEEERVSFPVPTTPKLPLTPGRERARAQLRKLNTLSSGIRGLQAKLHVLREESDKSLNDTEDVSELGSSLMMQYDSIGIDLKALMQEWEDGRAALAVNIDRNEKRVSSLGGMVSPASSLGGLTAVEEGTADDALRALNGEGRSRSSLEMSGSEVEEVFEAIAIPRQRSKLTREERIVKMKEDRVRRESMRDRADANTKMLRELESVINLRPRPRTTPAGENHVDMIICLTFSLQV
ncbi:hypothetical protein EYC84_011282 [Monilinia fructicola]|uniref:Myosin-binding domain-containing protein n=1 Tax=Monilinia fructicola TaxID=38448 RepID=A0A5M9J4X2_MONFR|nr:hypothetical protein EYC84_011282 [Monilinia fructicola]